MSPLYRWQIAKYKSFHVVYIYLVCVTALSAIDVPMSLGKHNKSSQNSSSCGQVPLSARCSGTMTSILRDISVEIRISLKKDISHRDGFRLISLSRSDRAALMFGYVGMKVARL